MTPPESGAEIATPSQWALGYLKEMNDDPEPVPRGKVRVELLTDPWSIWCWGFEPVRRTIELRYPGIEFRSVVGGMFESMPDPKVVGFDIERFFATVQRTTGMPIRLDAVRTDRPESTYPACIFTHAVRLLSPGAEAQYLRALREAAYLDGRNISRAQVGLEVAESIGIDAAAFTEAMESGEPTREFEERVRRFQASGLESYPTIMVRSGDKTGNIVGFQSLPALLSTLETFAGKLLVAREAPRLPDFIGETERIATREVAEVLGTSIEEAYEMLRDLEDAGELHSERHPTGDVWERQ